MTKVQVTSNINIDLDDVLEGVSKLDTTELERFHEQVSILLAQRKAPSLPEREVELLQQINQGLPPKVRERYHALRVKLRDETITPDEHQELLALIDQAEMADAERLQYLVELSQLRELPLDALMSQLGIHPPAVHV